MNEDDLWRFSDGFFFFFLSFFLLSLLSLSFLLVIMFLFFLLCYIERVGLDLVVGGFRRDLRVQSYHVFYLIVSLRFTVVSVFKLFFFLCVLSLLISL